MPNENNLTWQNTRKTRHRRTAAIGQGNTELDRFVGKMALQVPEDTDGMLSLDSLLVTPSEFVEKTSIWYKRRGKETRAMDHAYAEFYPVMLEYLKQQWKRSTNETSMSNHAVRLRSLNFFETLNALYEAKGSDWSKVTRNVASDGFLQEWFNHLDAICAPVLAKQKRRERRRLAKELVRARFGVLYLLGNLKVEISILPLVLEGVGQLTAAGVIGYGNAAHLNTSATSLDDVGGAYRTAMPYAGGFTYESVGRGVSKGLVKVAKVNHSASGTTAQVENSRKQQKKGNGYVLPDFATKKVINAFASDGFFPATSDIIEVIERDAQNITASGALGLVVGGTIGLGTALVVDTTRAAVGGVALAAAAAYDVLQTPVVLLKNIGANLQQVVIDLLNKVRESCFKDDLLISKVVGASIKMIASIVVYKVCEAAAPFVSGVSNLVSGVSQTILAAKDATVLWLNKRKITLRKNSHFTQISESVEWQQTKTAMSGLWNMLKGVGDIVANSILPGMGSLVSVMMSAVEWGVKCFTLIYEKYQIQNKLDELAKLWNRERDNAIRKVGATKDGKQLVSYQPNFRSGHRNNLSTNGRRFWNLYKDLCDTSVIFPMLTLNSGICGTITEQIEFYAHGSLIPQTQFDAGVAYFAKLKQLSSLHLRSCGLVFSSDDPTLEQIIRFAVRSHSGQGSTGVDKVLTGLGA